METWTNLSGILPLWRPSWERKIGTSSWGPGLKIDQKEGITSEQAMSSLFSRVFFRTCAKVLATISIPSNDLKASFPLGVPWQELGIA